MVPNLSIFVPVFNDEKYLEQCINSILNQSYRNFELHLYDDGSKDNSFQICLEYARKDDRIHVSHGENGGSIDAMNYFLKIAQGEYIGFVDDDDYIGVNYLSEMMKRLQAEDADCAISSYTYVDEQGKKIAWYTPQFLREDAITRDEACCEFLTSLNIEGFRWNKIYKKAIFVDNKIEFSQCFPADINAEFELLYRINKAVLVDSCDYFYRQSNGSDVATMNLEKRLGFLNTFKTVGDKAIRYGYVDEGKYYKVWRSVNCLYGAKKDVKNCLDKREKIIKEKYKWKKWIEMPLLKTLIIANKYNDVKNGNFKLIFKIIMTWVTFR